MGERLGPLPEAVTQAELTPEPLPETAPVTETVIFDRQLYDRQWQKDKRTQRLANLAIAHGYVHTGSGQVYYDHGVSSKPRRKK